MKAGLAFVAIGGNSLIKSKDLQKVEDQHAAIRETVAHVVDLIDQGYQIIISHGNGPQVGFIMRRSEVARRAVGLHLVPLVNAVADTQGSIGYQIQQSMNNELAARNLAGQCVTLVTQVVVDEDDPAFLKPAKPVGEFFDTTQLEDIRREYPEWSLLEDAGRGYRRVVPSPEPHEIVEKPVIESLLREGYHVVAAGGGGIPVVRRGNEFIGVDAVIDKDHVSSLLASQLGADLLIISTAVEQVALNFGKPDQQLIGTMSVGQAQSYIKQNHFAPGSMLPKIEAAIKFINSGGKEVIITAPQFIKEAVLSGKGTHIIP
ncbi:carbamate kinase [Desulfopila sp. IMCC35006]|uniref:carbamate kinase n=1 Tax=Desulfopila sp. IMCC35006 TaxID=2569542 RepID=UPI0010ACBD31|nr:carbamate kinase [Desulfopila sp. IMCC35006]TKB23873.1 carbamate kinase [Desulfopila sp. IMCC35006]